MNNKAYLQISFSWVFAIIVGVFIIFLAIYAVTKFVNTENEVSNLEVGKEIGILFNPLEISFESAKTTELTLRAETRIYNQCDNLDYFGNSGIQLSQKSFNKWTSRSDTVKFQNKYLFSEEAIEGRKFYIFSKPLELPFKIADLIYITPASEKYCFIGASSDIEREIKNLNQGNLIIEENCSGDEINVCFDTPSCEIYVNEIGKYVKKKGSIVYFEEDALMYAAIFSDKDVYECQVKRIAKRLEMLATIYQEKATLVTVERCNTNLNLLGLSNMAQNLQESSDLSSLGYIAQNIKNKQENANCKLW